MTKDVPRRRKEKLLDPSPRLPRRHPRAQAAKPAASAAGEHHFMIGRMSATGRQPVLRLPGWPIYWLTPSAETLISNEEKNGLRGGVFIVAFATAF